MTSSPRIGIVGVFLVACAHGSGARSAAEGMREAACSGDTAAFFNRIDRTRMAANLRGPLLRTATEQAAKNLDLPIEAVEDFNTNDADMRRAIESEYARGTQRLFTRWEDDVKKGRVSGFCNTLILDYQGDEVRVRYRTGYEHVWVFTRFGDVWLLTYLLYMPSCHQADGCPQIPWRKDR